MFSSLIIAFREGFEAVLVVGIILTYLQQTNRTKISKFVLWGTIAGTLISIVGGYIGFNEAQGLEEAGEELLEGIMMLISSGLIAFFVVWMANQNKNISSSIKNSVDKSSTGLGLFILAFLSVFREGAEIITLILTKVSQHASSIALGTAIGIVLAMLIGYIIFKTSVKLNIKVIFKVLGVILIFMGAELFGESLVKFIPAGGEVLENVGMVSFGLISFIYFLKEDINKIVKKGHRHSVD
jgi:high-affinity iron transporter